MATRIKKKQTPIYSETDIRENHILSIVDKEFTTGKSNMENKISDFESAIDMLECERTEKNADWKSDIAYPEFTSQMLTLASDEASQYFQTKDFVEVYIEDESPENILKAEANKELINRTLNQRELNHYQKFMRANITKDLGGDVYAKCGWIREVDILDVSKKRDVEADVDVNGNPIVDKAVQIPAMVSVTENIPTPVTKVDRFNYEILDKRNVYTDNSYVYNLQDKKWIIIREEKTLNELKDSELTEKYINLDKIGKTQIPQESDTSKESYNKDDADTPAPLIGDEPLDVYHRYGKFWAVVKQKYDSGNPASIEYGIDPNGKPLPNALLVECIISWVRTGSSKYLVRFIPTPFVSSHGIQYRPIIRGICYIHPTKDMGLGDGKFARELQIGINDTLNISNDRVMLATLPTLKGNKYALEDNTSIYFEPNHIMLTDSPDDIEEFKISDNIQGALQQINLLRMGMSGVTSIFPPALGNVPEMSSTTATAVAGADQSKSKRSSYRSLTFEHTFLNPLYWMITQMTWQFAEENTAFKLMGEKVYDFDPNADYTYKPLSQSIISEYSKTSQIRELNQMIGLLAPVVSINPKGAQLINFILAKVFKLYGDENAEFSKFLLDENAPVGTQPAGINETPMQNQAGMPQPMMEQEQRGIMSGGLM
jgi:hypothetical protein